MYHHHQAGGIPSPSGEVGRAARAIRVAGAGCPRAVCAHAMGLQSRLTAFRARRCHVPIAAYTGQCWKSHESDNIRLFSLTIITFYLSSSFFLSLWS